MSAKFHTQLMHNATAMGGAFSVGGNNGIGELTEGTQGAAVRELQSKLNVLQYGPVEVNGTFDGATRIALQNFQSVEGLPPTGKLDATSEARLNQRILSVQMPVSGQAQQAQQQAQPADQQQQPPTFVQQQLQQRPLWQTGLMLLGGVALVGGVIYLLSEKESTGGYRNALTSRTVDHDDNSPTRYKREVRAHGATPRGAHRTKCPRTPGDDAFVEGEPLSAISQETL